MEGITLEDLRNTICHSFVTVGEDKGDSSVHGKTLILDDRVLYHNRKDHMELSEHSYAWRIQIKYVHKRLEELINEILNK